MREGIIRSYKNSTPTDGAWYLYLYFMMMVSCKMQNAKCKMMCISCRGRRVLCTLKNATTTPHHPCRKMPRHAARCHGVRARLTFRTEDDKHDMMIFNSLINIFSSSLLRNSTNIIITTKYNPFLIGRVPE